MAMILLFILFVLEFCPIEGLNWNFPWFIWMVFGLFWLSEFIEKLATSPDEPDEKPNDKNREETNYIK